MTNKHEEEYQEKEFDLQTERHNKIINLLKASNDNLRKALNKEK